MCTCSRRMQQSYPQHRVDARRQASSVATLPMKGLAGTLTTVGSEDVGLIVGGYLSGARHPAARASLSVQNQRSPLAASIFTGS